MFVQKLKIGILLSLIIAIAIIGANVTKVKAGQDDPAPPRFSVNRDTVKVGDVVGYGRRNANGDCKFGGYSIETNIPKENKLPRWITIAADISQCQAVVKAKWNGSFVDGPPEIVNSVLGSLPAESQASGLLYGDANTGSATTMGALKTSEQVILENTPGGGQAAFVRVRLTWYYDGALAYLSQSYKECNFLFPGSGTVDGCIWSRFTNTSPGSSIWLDAWGSFTLNYKRQIQNFVAGQADGSSSCWGGGTYPLGTRRYIIQGCQ